MQQPHPPYIVGTGSPETMGLAAQLGFGCSACSSPKQAQELNNNLRGAPPPMATVRPDQLPLGIMAMLPETQEKARLTSRPHPRFSSRTPAHLPQYLAPPDIVVDQLKARAAIGDKTTALQTRW